MLMREFTPGQGGAPSKCISLVLILIVHYLGNTSSKPFLLPLFFSCDCLKNFLLPLTIYNSYHYYDDILHSIFEPALISCPLLK